MTSTPRASGSQSSLREANGERLVSAIRQFGSITQVELSRATGLSPATVSTIVKQLLAAGTVETRNTIRSGRRAQLVTMAHRSGLLVGLHVGARALRVAISDTSFGLLDQRELPLSVDHRYDTTLDRAAVLISELTEGLGSTLTEVLGVGIGLPAPVDPLTQSVTVPGIFRGWEGIKPAQILSDRLGCAAVVHNDANLGALGEMRFGAARGLEDVIYVRASHTVGAGIVVGGEIHHGTRGMAGEIGHVLVDPQGPICKCGSRGCLNTLCSAQALIESLRHARAPITLADMLDLATAGDPGCQQVLIDAGATIGLVVTNAAVSLSPQAILVGGELARAGDLFIEPMREAIRRRVVLSVSASKLIQPAELGTNAELLGALAAAADHANVTAVAS